MLSGVGLVSGCVFGWCGGRPRTMLQLRTRTETSFGTGAEALHSPWPARNTPPFWGGSGAALPRCCRLVVGWVLCSVASLLPAVFWVCRL